MLPKTLKLLLLFAVSLSVLNGCTTELREPICRPDEFYFPDEYAGVYKITVPMLNPVYSGLSSFEDTFVELGRKNGKPTLYINRTKLLPLKLKSPVIKRWLNVRSAARASDSPDPRQLNNFLPVKVCRIERGEGYIYYAQTLTDNGTYALTRVDFSANGITVTPVAFDPVALEKAGIPRYFLPQANSETANNDELFGTVDMIVDNRQVSRKTLIAQAQTVSFLGLLLTKVPGLTELKSLNGYKDVVALPLTP